MTLQQLPSSATAAPSLALAPLAGRRTSSSSGLTCSSTTCALHIDEVQDKLTRRKADLVPSSTAYPAAAALLHLVQAQ